MVLPARRVVGKQEPQRPLFEEAVVDRIDLMGVGLDVRRVDGGKRVGQVSPAHAPGLRGEPKVCTIGIEGPAACRRHADTSEIIGSDDPFAHLAVDALVDQHPGLFALALEIHHRHVTVRQDSSKPGTTGHLVEIHCHSGTLCKPDGTGESAQALERPTSVAPQNRIADSADDGVRSDRCARAPSTRPDANSGFFTAQAPVSLPLPRPEL